MAATIFLNENVRLLIKISLKFVPKGPINNNPALVQIMAWRRSGDKPLSEPMMVSLLTHICVARPQWVKSLHYGCAVDMLYLYLTGVCCSLTLLLFWFLSVYLLHVCVWVCWCIEQELILWTSNILAYKRWKPSWEYCEWIFRFIFLCCKLFQLLHVIPIGSAL